MATHVSSVLTMLVAIVGTFLISMAVWVSLNVVHIQMYEEDAVPGADGINIYVRGTPEIDSNVKAKTNSYDLFHENTYGFAVYRLPAIVYHQQTFLVFCEGRMGTADSSVSQIVMQRGLLNGTKITWDKIPTTVAKINQTRLANPTPVVDNVTNTIFVAYNVLPAHVTEEEFLARDRYNQSVFIQKSTDLGQTWSDPYDITDETLGQMKPVPVFYAPGPGHGIQMKSGRLVVQGNFYYREINSTHKTYKSNTSDHSVVFLSDNHGKNWRPGGFVPYGEDAKGRAIHTSEATVVELANNTLCINSRTLGKDQPRAQSFSTDGGEKFGLPQLVEELIEPENVDSTPGCEGSILGFPATPSTIDKMNSGGEQQRWALFSNPANSLIRIEMSIRHSTDGCQTWSKPWTIWELASGYSDLVQYENTNSINKHNYGVDEKDDQGPLFGLVYENGYYDSVSTVSFMTFTIEDVISGIRATELRKSNHYQVVS